MPTTEISVKMEVTRYHVYSDNLIEIWGYVGDYEVCVHLPLEKARSQGLVVPARRGRVSRQRHHDANQQRG